jgi:hypothetical protein
MTDTVRFINKEGIELFQIVKDKTGANTYDTVILKITIALLYHLELQVKDV